MSNVDELIKLHCPNGVPFVSLNDIGKVSMCKRIFKEQTSVTGDIPFYKIGTFGKLADSYIDKNIYEEFRNKYTFPKKGDILISASGTIGRLVIYDGKPAYFQDSNIVWIDNDETKVLNKFLYYLYQTVRWQTEGGTINRLYNDNIKKIKIPVPPLEVQRSILQVLDYFTELGTLLEKELEARKKQYEHYQGTLLDTSDDVKHISLEDICSLITDGSHTSPKSVSEGYYMPSVKDMRPNGFDLSACKMISKMDFETLVKNGCMPQKNDVLIAKDGSMLKYAFTVEGERDIVLLSSIAILRPKLNIVNPKYLSHYFRLESFKSSVIRNFSSKGGVPRIILKNFKKVKVPVPSLVEQDRLVSILDKYDRLINDTYVGLPAEITARNLQYEYYRGKLLTFQELPA